MIDIEHKITPNEILSFKKCKKRHQDWLNRKAACQTASPEDVTAIVKGPDGQEYQVPFEDIAKVSEKLGEIAGFQVIVHRPYELNDTRAA